MPKNNRSRDKFPTIIQNIYNSNRETEIIYLFIITAIKLKKKKKIYLP